MTGKQECSFDPKGRLIVPAKFRDELGEQFYITPGLDGCLAVYPEAKWQGIMAKIAAAPPGCGQEGALYAGKHRHL